MPSDLDLRLALLEQRVEDLVRQRESEREEADRARNVGRWIRLGVLAVLAAVYALYFNTLSALG